MSLRRRWINWTIEGPSCVVDGADVPIFEPPNQARRVRTKFFAKKCGGPALKYLFVTHVSSGEFLWASEAFPGGCYEPHVVEQQVIPHLYPREKILADRLYRSHKRFLTSTGKKDEWSRRVDSVRSRVERRIGRLNSFAIFRDRYRSANYHAHSEYDQVLCRMINLCGSF